MSRVPSGSFHPVMRPQSVPNEVKTVEGTTVPFVLATSVLERAAGAGRKKSAILVRGQAVSNTPAATGADNQRDLDINTAGEAPSLVSNRITYHVNDIQISNKIPTPNGIPENIPLSSMTNFYQTTHSPYSAAGNTANSITNASNQSYPLQPQHQLIDVQNGNLIEISNNQDSNYSTSIYSSKNISIIQSPSQPDLQKSSSVIPSVTLPEPPPKTIHSNKYTHNNFETIHNSTVTKSMNNNNNINNNDNNNSNNYAMQSEESVLSTISVALKQISTNTNTPKKMNTSLNQNQSHSTATPTSENKLSIDTNPIPSSQEKTQASVTSSTDNRLLIRKLRAARNFLEDLESEYEKECGEEALRSLI